VTIVCGETGSGKSTQLPKICLGLGRGIDGLIGHTQPRRIAARSVAARIAEELDSPLGRHVGFKIRFTDATQPETYIKLMTDGILLAETQGDRFLDQYDTIIIDEAHERSLNIDFLLGYLKRLLPRRRDLKLIITSATIDAARFSEHFTDPQTDEPAPIIEVSGRTYPVDVLYRPLQAEGDRTATIWICRTRSCRRWTNWPHRPRRHPDFPADGTGHPGDGTRHCAATRSPATAARRRSCPCTRGSRPGPEQGVSTAFAAADRAWPPTSPSRR
jgi:HrpA-like RNA helicase